MQIRFHIINRSIMSCGSSIISRRDTVGDAWEKKK